MEVRIFPFILRQAQDERKNPYNPKQGNCLYLYPKLEAFLAKGRRRIYRANV